MEEEEEEFKDALEGQEEVKEEQAIPDSSFDKSIVRSSDNNDPKKKLSEKAAERGAQSCDTEITTISQDDSERLEDFPSLWKDNGDSNLHGSDDTQRRQQSESTRGTRQTKEAPIPQTNGDTEFSSALRSSIAKYGKNSYYYAHSKTPASSNCATVIEGPGIVTGGSPILISSEHNLSLQQKLLSSVRRISLTKYSWRDSGSCVKVYVSLDAFPLCSTIAHNRTPVSPDTAKVEFGDRHVNFSVTDETASSLYELRLPKLSERIRPKESSYAFSSSRFTLSLKKHDVTTTWYKLLNSFAP